MTASILNYGQLDVIRVYIKGLAESSRATRHAERHHLERIARKLKGVYSKKHQKGATKPQPPKAFKLPEKADQLIDEAYANYWNLHQMRTQEIRRETRACLLAYNFLRGKDYAEAEAAGAWSYPDFALIWNFVLDELPKGMGDNERKVVFDEFEKWKTKALIFWRENTPNEFAE